ncbi:MAG: DUF2490 domain-containing protein [Flavobacteriales bacterium]|nr:DUF2490 domain-containing protein [Flavobacteriales bacterium]
MKRFALLILLVIPSLSWAQNDFFNRYEVGLKIKPSKRFTAQLSGQYRWNVSERLYSKTLFSTRLKYDIAKPFSILATYRRTWMPNEFFYLDNQENTYGHRFAAGFSWDILRTIKPKAKSSFKYTSQYQKEFFKYKRERIIWRNRISLDLHIGLKRMTPVISVESFFRTNHYFQIVNDVATTSGLMREIRYGFGLNFDLPNNHKIQIGGLYRNIMTKKNDAWVMQFSYFYTIEKKKKKAPRTIGVPEF